jgi:hypothetical protein
MADDRYGNRDRARPSSSIFSDDDDGRSASGWRSEDYGWGRSDHGRGQGSSGGRAGSGEQDDRGFISRAGDEVRSWFGDEEAERRREQDARRYEQEHGTSGRYQGGGHEDQWTGGSASRSSGSGQYERSRMTSNAPGGRSAGQDDDYGRRGAAEGGFGQNYGARSARTDGYGQTDQQRAASHHDETYRRWRERQIEALDREYEEYCRHRQTQFENEFSSFRQSRQSGTGQSAPQNAATTTTGAGDASAVTSSTGSSGSAEQSTTGESAGKSRRT